MLQQCVCVWYCAGAVLGSVSVRRAGWLDRAVSYHRGRFLNDVQETAPIQIQASLVRGAAEADEASVWDYAAVERLLALLGANEGAAPLRRELRRALRPSAPTRRFISKKESWKMFPSLGKNHGNNIYYDFDSKEMKSEENAGVAEFEMTDDVVLVIENPVEARLPSARISVKLLRDILEARAVAARAMPSTVRSSIPWIPMKNMTSAAGPAAGGEDAAAVDEADSPASTQAAGAGGATDATGEKNAITVAAAGEGEDGTQAETEPPA